MSTGTLPILNRPETPDIDAVSGPPGLDWPALLSPQQWLGHETPAEFLGVSGADVLDVVAREELEAFFAERAVHDESVLHCLLDADVNCISHSLSALLSMSNDAAKRLMPTRIRRVVGQNDVEFDHIGVEIFGKLEWYIELFDRAFAPMDINVVKEHIFPSVQVRRALQYDANLGDVRIGRIYFSHGEITVNLEVFEATQNWKHIALRQAALYAHLREPTGRRDAFLQMSRSAGLIPEPVGHVAFRVPCAKTVESIQAVLLKESRKSRSPAMRPYVRKAFYNPSDGSTNTKFVMSTEIGSGQKLDSQIVEVISYEE